MKFFSNPSPFFFFFNFLRINADPVNRADSADTTAFAYRYETTFEATADCRDPIMKLFTLLALVASASADALPRQSPVWVRGGRDDHTHHGEAWHDATAQATYLMTEARAARLLMLKAASGKTFDELADELGLTNAYTCQLLLGQAMLNPGTVAKLKAALPGISPDDLAAMEEPPMRVFDKRIMMEPNVYRTYEAVMHYGQAIKMLINEQCGDGIMSAIDFYLDVGTTKGKQGEKRVVITLNGKFLPHIEQRLADNTLGKGPRG
mmetsp:Transcript_74636/g.212720  ORF Transcript_74636/g.212720 Transcript_74636/m.212720 type:complete len:264 (+) Transcript_74636:84-875(+)